MKKIETAQTESTSEFSLPRRQILRGLSAAASVPLVSTGLSMTATATQAAPPVVAPARITTQAFRVALCAREASPQLNIIEGINKFISLMQEAKASGARMLVCGELWLPGYPVQLNFDNNWRRDHWSNYVANSLTVGDANWQRILEACRTIGIQVSFGFSELAGNYAYMSQAIIGEDGKLIYKRRKVRPSGSERNYWSDDVMAPNLVVPTTPLGRISMLMCWDHLRPQSTFNMMAQLPNIHICAWPYIPKTGPSVAGWERQEVGYTSAAYFSQLTGAVTLIASVGYAAVFTSSIKVAELTPDEPAELLYYTITPRSWSGRTDSPTSEFSYGVLGLLGTNFPGNKVSDPEHETLKLNPLI